MDNARLSFLSRKYVNDKCSETEREEFFRLMADPANDEQVKLLMGRLWDQAPEKALSKHRAEHMFNTIITERMRPLFPLLKMAAVFVIMVLSVLAAVYFQADYQKTRIAQIKKDARTSFFTLPDGSTVILNTGSTLEYASTFVGNVREVFLEGEGFFDIKNDPSRPFVVNTGKFRTTVLGTAFNVKAYPGQTITVTVKRGKVKVGDSRRVFGVLNANEQLSLADTHGYPEEKKAIDSHCVTEWIEKDIFFEDVTMAEAIHELAKRFGVPITLDDFDPRACTFTATFARGENLAQILTIVCEFNNARLAESGSGGFVISGGDCGGTSQQ